MSKYSDMRKLENRAACRNCRSRDDACIERIFRGLGACCVMCKTTDMHPKGKGTHPGPGNKPADHQPTLFAPDDPREGKKQTATFNQTQATLTAEDGERLTTQAERVFSVMGDAGEWWTLKELAAAANATEAGASARLRDFRKPHWGEHTVQRRREGNLYLYRLIPNGPLLDGKRNTPTPKMEAREYIEKYMETHHIDQPFRNAIMEILK